MPYVLMETVWLDMQHVWGAIWRYCSLALMMPAGMPLMLLVVR